jgi:hypothetical protein
MPWSESKPKGFLKQEKRKMKREVFPEYLGDVSTEQLLQNVTKTNPTASANLDCIREMFPRGFAVHGEFQVSVFENETERNQYSEAVIKRLKQATDSREQIAALVPADKMLVRLILEPK